MVHQCFKDCAVELLWEWRLTIVKVGGSCAKSWHCQLAGVAAARNTRDVGNSEIHLLWMFHRPKHTRLPNKTGPFCEETCSWYIVLFYWPFLVFSTRAAFLLLCWLWFAKSLLSMHSRTAGSLGVASVTLLHVSNLAKLVFLTLFVVFQAATWRRRKKR